MCDTMSESELELNSAKPAVNFDKRHSYRFGYLKSEHWSNLRIQKLASVDAVCIKCGVRDLGNDVHHINYRNLYDVGLDDLVVVCRGCHEQIHAYLDRCKEGYYDAPGAPNQWKDFLDLWNGNPGGCGRMGDHIKALKKSREAYACMVNPNYFSTKSLKRLKLNISNWKKYHLTQRLVSQFEDYII